MLSCRPAQAARRRDAAPREARSSRSPTCRRWARICVRVRLNPRADVISQLFSGGALRQLLAKWGSRRGPSRGRPLHRREVSGCRHPDSGHVSRATFQSVVGAMSDPDYTALDRLMPHPVYALQHWVSVLNPSVGTFESVVKPLLEEAHARVARAPTEASAKEFAVSDNISPKQFPKSEGVDDWRV